MSHAFLRPFLVIALFVPAARARAEGQIAATATPPAAALHSPSEEHLVTTAPPAQPPKPARRMGWFGVGARVGFAYTRLVPPASTIASVNRSSAQAGSDKVWSESDLGFSTSALSITPTLHLGGSGYFFKLDLPITLASELTSVGLGLYPVNVGVYVDRINLLPYVSLGAAFSLLRSTASGDAGRSSTLTGGIVQGRLALGAKYFPARASALSVEAGYSPWAAGIVALPDRAMGDPSIDRVPNMKGGFGSVVDLSFGAEWL